MQGESARVGMINAFAQATAASDYKALVCVFLFGGNDGINTRIDNGFAEEDFINGSGIQRFDLGTFGGFSGIAGCIALAIIVIPIVVRTTEDMLQLIPPALREAAVALGAPKWKMIVLICYRAARQGITTGVLLAVARIAGETAPLLFTAFNNRFFSTSLNQPISSLTVQVFTYAISPYEEWHRQAWAGALVLVTLVLLCSILARLATRRLERLQTGQ